MASNVKTPTTEDLSFVGKAERADDEIDGCVQLRDEAAHIKQDNATDITKQSILDFGDEGYLLKGLMTPEECEYVTSRGESIGFYELIGYPREYRNNDRLIVRSPHLAKVLWARVRPHLKVISIDGDPGAVHVSGPTLVMQGRWQPYRVNPVFRLCKYHPGGHFGPHYDGNFVVSSTERTMQTLMLYLNDQFEGGTTNFIDDKKRTPYYLSSQKDQYAADPKNILHKVQPVKGMGILFNHHRLHEGETVRTGTKYILRTDIIYRKVDVGATDSTVETAFQLLQQAETLESAGETMEAMELYRKAFRLCPSLEF